MRLVQIFLISLLTACSTTGSRAKVVLEQDGFISTTATALTESVKNGDERVLEESNPLLFEAPGFLPMLVLPPQPTADKISLRLKPLGADEARSQEVERILSDVLQVQTLIRDKKGREAITLADDLLARYPRVQQLRRLKAGCLLVLGERKAADAFLKQTEEPKPSEPPKPETKEEKP